MTDNDKSIPVVPPAPQSAMPASPLSRLLFGITLLASFVAALGLFQVNQTRRQSLQQAKVRG